MKHRHTLDASEAGSGRRGQRHTRASSGSRDSSLLTHLFLDELLKNPDPIRSYFPYQLD